MASAAKGIYAGMVFPLSSLSEIRKRLKVKTLDRARRIVEENGGRFVVPAPALLG